jgi:predicted Rossmann fold nucleotide-binding protein DprA/Smf involved in DNA uptake
METIRAIATNSKTAGDEALAGIQAATAQAVEAIRTAGQQCHDVALAEIRAATVQAVRAIASRNKTASDEAIAEITVAAAHAVETVRIVAQQRQDTSAKAQQMGLKQERDGKVGNVLGETSQWPRTRAQEFGDKIVDLLANGPQDVDTITAALGATVNELSGILLILEMRKLIRRMPGNIYEAIT